ncbi:MAG: tRNA preQ1(34) S-adenosylmethionine ribosyltransferase-isomerase QueA [Acidimicrobiia bacterium]|nr:tRNA preQ1(34) S-adenosylmethionine ribosyltransferase-isomerase QueA [Acidimicrobiia bacterium]
MDLAAFDYDLPPERIAQRPVEPRDAARLLVDDGPGCPPRHLTVADLPTLVRPGDLIVVNDTRVLRARLLLQKSTGAQVEVLLLEPTAGGWEALVKPSRKVAPGTTLRPRSDGAGTAFEVEVGADLGEGRRHVRLRTAHEEMAALDRHGEIPLPPYIHEQLDDPERYQTVYADRPASVAAPTAGLHLTPAVLEACEAAGAVVARIELVVGLGTFRPITVERVEDHVMHAEQFRVPPETMAACETAARVVAVGTTTVRALESAAALGMLVGRTELFIRGDHPWRVVDVLLTNFHVPRSSLLVMIDAFVGPRWRDLYDVALAEQYRFLSFGDAMLLQRGPS